jgi:uncharacterized protein
MYWKEPGSVNSASTAMLALAKARETGIRYLVVASNTGETAKLVGDPELTVVCVTHQSGFRSPGENEMTPETRQELTQAGYQVLTTTHLFANTERAVTNKFGGLYVGGVISHTLRMFGQGTKVCVEIAVMALDAGLIPYGEDVIAIGGSGGGADTAIVLRPAHSQDFFATEIREVICKPRETK